MVSMTKYFYPIDENHSPKYKELLEFKKNRILKGKRTMNLFYFTMPRNIRRKSSS
jgi:hypothetical protein